MSGANIKELAKLLGTNIILEVIGGATFNGVLYSVDADSGLVALRENAIGHQADYNIVNAAHIVKFSSPPGGPVSAELREVLSSKVAAVPEDTLQKFYARESEQVGCLLLATALSLFQHLRSSSPQVRKASEHVQRTIGDGVSKDAQRLFNLLQRALPCSWSQHTIVVGTQGSEDEVRISPPYTTATCSGKVPGLSNTHAQIVAMF